MKPKVSIIVPIYNTEKHLDKCIGSIVNQSLKEIEIILINDGSTDDSHYICEKYQKKYPNKIVYINNKNIGCSATRNLGINIAKADYIGFVDSDDYIEKDMYLDMYTKMREENLDLVIAGIIYRYPNKEIIKIRIPQNTLNKDSLFDERNMIVLTSNKLFKKEIILSNEIKFKEGLHFNEDLLFSFQYTINIKKFGVIKKAYYNYIQHGFNSVYNIEKRLDAFKIYEELFKYIKIKKNNNLLKYYYKLFGLYVIGGTYMLLSDKKHISTEDYFIYRKIFLKNTFEFKYIRLYDKVRVVFWYLFSIFIRKFNMKMKLLKIRRFLRKE